MKRYIDEGESLPGVDKRVRPTVWRPEVTTLEPSSLLHLWAGEFYLTAPAAVPNAHITWASARLGVVVTDDHTHDAVFARVHANGAPSTLHDQRILLEICAASGLDGYIIFMNPNARIAFVRPGKHLVSLE